MHYINPNRKLGLSGLLRVRNDEDTLAQSIDSCIDALDELIITYHECNDKSLQIINDKKQQYSDKIIVIPYPYHVLGVGVTDEESEIVRSLPIGHPQLLASYYNNALQYVNYKYVLKIDADQIYFSQSLSHLRNYIVGGVSQGRIGRLLGKAINEVYCYRRGNWRIWSKWHPAHWLQYIVVPLFKKQYEKFAVSEFLKGRGNLSLSGVNVLRYQKQWYSPLGNKIYGMNDDFLWPYSGFGDHLVFEANEQTEYVPFFYRIMLSSSNKGILIERLDSPQKNKFLMGFYWFHLKPMKNLSDSQYIPYLMKPENKLIPVEKLEKTPFRVLSRYLLVEKEEYYNNKRSFYNFLHNLDKKSINANVAILKSFTGF